MTASEPVIRLSVTEGSSVSMCSRRPAAALVGAAGADDTQSPATSGWPSPAPCGALCAKAAVEVRTTKTTQTEETSNRIMYAPLEGTRKHLSCPIENPQKCANHRDFQEAQARR